jgi:MarR family transcriptional regulator for hemolysin
MRSLTITRLKHDFENSVGYLVYLTNRAFQRAVNEELQKLNVTFRQMQVLAWLALDGELTQRELAARMEVEGATIVGIIDSMERKGWIARCPDPADRRKNVIRPTPQVEPVWTQMLDIIQRVRRRAFAGMSEDELNTLRRLLRRIQDNLRAAGADCSSASRPRAAAATSSSR